MFINIQISQFAKKEPNYLKKELIQTIYKKQNIYMMTFLQCIVKKNKLN